MFAPHLPRDPRAHVCSAAKVREELGRTADAGSKDNAPGPYSGGCTLRRPGPHPDRRIAQIYRRFEAQVTIIEKGAGAGRLSGHGSSSSIEGRGCAPTPAASRWSPTQTVSESASISLEFELGRVGLTETEARKTGRPFSSQASDERGGPRGRAEETKGFMKVVTDTETENIRDPGRQRRRSDPRDPRHQERRPLQRRAAPYPTLQWVYRSIQRFQTGRDICKCTRVAASRAPWASPRVSRT